MKTCVRCLIEKEEWEFRKDKLNRDGLNSHCRKCNANTCRAHRQANRARTEVLVPLVEYLTFYLK